MRTGNIISLSVNTQLLAYANQISAWKYGRINVAKSPYRKRCVEKESGVLGFSG